jgi:hypothetical protein
MDGLDVCDRRYARERSPGGEFLACLRVGAPRVRVADIGGEKFKEAHARLVASGINQRRQRVAGEKDELVHDTKSSRVMQKSGARHAPWRVGLVSSISPTFFKPQCSRTFCEGELLGSVWARIV